MCETDYKLFIISCMKVIHSNFAISTFAYIILSVFSFLLSFFHGKGLRMKKFLDFIRLEAVSPSRVKRKWKKINLSMPRGALGATSFYLRDGLRRKGGTTHSKKFLAIIWPYFVSPTQRKNKIQILRQPQRSSSFLLIWNQTEQNMVYWYLKKPITISLQQENEILLFYLSRRKIYR